VSTSLKPRRGLQWSTAVIQDPEMAKAFASFQGKFKGGIFTSENARQFSALQAQGADALAIKVGDFAAVNKRGSCCYVRHDS
jgi:hypothetical protein